LREGGGENWVREGRRDGYGGRKGGRTKGKTWGNGNSKKKRGGHKRGRKGRG